MYPREVIINSANIDKLTATFKGAYREIIGEIRTATNFGVARRRALLKQVERTLIDLGVDVADFVRKEIPPYYVSGADDAIKQLKNVKARITSGEDFNVIHKQAIATIVDETAEAFAESISGVGRSANLLISQAVKDQIQQQLAIGALKGSNIAAIRENIIATIQSKGIYAVVDKGGRGWTLDRYAEMLIRTKAVEARNRGLANRMVENGYDLVQVSQHQSEHKECRFWEGKVLSLTGKTTTFNGERIFTVQYAKDKGLFHPNCKHAINVLIPELARQTYSYNTRSGKYERGVVRAF